jgi:hypothetical protein
MREDALGNESMESFGAGGTRARDHRRGFKWREREIERESFGRRKKEWGRRKGVDGG